MTLEDMKKWRDQLADELERRKRLGDFDANAASFVLLTESLLRVVTALLKNKSFTRTLERKK